MPQDRPDATSLLNTVSLYLAELTPQLEGKQRFDALISRHILDIVARELRFGGHVAEKDTEDRQNLFNSSMLSGHGDADLCTAIRCGHFDDRWEELIATLTRTIARKCWIVRPEHLAECDRNAISATVPGAPQNA